MREVRTTQQLSSVDTGRSNEPLTLAGDQVTDETIDELLHRTDIKSLWLRGCGSVTKSGYRQLLAIQGLKELSIWGGSSVDGLGESTAGTCSITALSLVECDISDALLERMLRCEQLTTVAIAFCNDITDEGLSSLSALPRLQKISVLACRTVTGEFRNAMVKQRPQCEVVFEAAE